MRIGPYAAWLALAALALAGCGSPKAPVPGVSPEGDLPEPPPHADALTARLVLGSGAAFPDLWYLDRVDLPGTGNFSLALGRGVRCEGDATAAFPGAGWVDCWLRLAADAANESHDRRPLEVGFDYQIMTLETPVAPVEWRVAVSLTRTDSSVATMTRAFDSGWRALDLTPRVDNVTARLEAGADPCDAPDDVEEQTGNSGSATLNVSFDAAFASAVIAVELADSRQGNDPGPTASPYAHAAPPQPHNFTATFPLLALAMPMWLRLPVDLETPPEPPADSAGPCGPAALAHDVQEWSVNVTFSGADAVVRSASSLVVPVDVYVVLQA